MPTEPCCCCALPISHLHLFAVSLPSLFPFSFCFLSFHRSILVSGILRKRSLAGRALIHSFLIPRGTGQCFFLFSSSSFPTHFIASSPSSYCRSRDPLARLTNTQKEAVVQHKRLLYSVLRNLFCYTSFSLSLSHSSFITYISAEPSFSYSATR